MRKFKKMDERKLVLDDTKARDWEIKIICALYVTIKKGLSIAIPPSVPTLPHKQIHFSIRDPDICQK